MEADRRLEQIADYKIWQEHEIRYYDTDGNGNVIVRNAKAVTLVPKVGQTVLVAYEMGISRLPRCLGVIQSTNWITSED